LDWFEGQAVRDSGRGGMLVTGAMEWLITNGADEMAEGPEIAVSRNAGFGSD